MKINKLTTGISFLHLFNKNSLFRFLILITITIKMKCLHARLMEISMEVYEWSKNTVSYFTTAIVYIEIYTTGFFIYPLKYTEINLVLA